MTEMLGDIRRIIYTSKARYLPDAEVEALYRVSIDRNRREGVTGLLLYDGARFLQAIEGQDAVVRATMSRILRDSRHQHVHLTFHAPVAARAFAGWSMAQTGARPHLRAPAFLMAVKTEVEGLADVQLQALFIGFAKLATTRA